MSKLTLTALVGATLVLASPAYAARGGGASANVAVSNLSQAAMKIDTCRHQRCENARRRPCRIRKGWFAEGLDPLIR